jgi:Mrp family chromosome partitioning ATPase
MGKHALVLDKAGHQVELFDPLSLLERGSKHLLPGEDVYTKLAATLFESRPQRNVVAFVAVKPGSGATHMVRNIGAVLARAGRKVSVKDGSLRSLRLPGIPQEEQDFDEAEAIMGMPFSAEEESTALTVTDIREQYDCVLIDAGCADTSAGLTRVGPFCDGVVLIAEAGEVTKAQVRRATQTVMRAQGKLLGVVLNKRSYPIPDWLYRLL